MHRIVMPGVGLETSCLGMGCASLGSRISGPAGLRALAAAHEAGLRWFDVAPAYGAGEAETLLGRFLAGTRRDGVQICTKVGLLPPPQNSLKRAARALLRPAMSSTGPLRRMLRRSGMTTNRSIALTPELIRDSVEQSLRRLGTDHIDLLALHNAGPADLQRDDIFETLSELALSGKIGAAAVASSAAVAQEALRFDTPVAVLQFSATDPLAPDVLVAAKQAGRRCITHSVFGVAGALDTLALHLAQNRALAIRATEGLEAAGISVAGAGPRPLAATFLLAHARACNPDGVVLASMFSASSLAGNLAVAQVDPARLAALDRTVPDLLSLF